MIKGINEESCIHCGICENICPMDVFRRDKDNRVYLAYQADCSSCMNCTRFCPVDAIIITGHIARKYDVSQRWERVKKMMGVKSTPSGESL